MRMSSDQRDAGHLFFLRWDRLAFVVVIFAVMGVVVMVVVMNIVVVVVMIMVMVGVMMLVMEL